MMKSPKLLNSSFLFVVFCLVGCRDKQELGFLGDIEVGKYEITQFREYPNGTKDTLIWEAYGPLYPKGGARYYFSVHDSSDFPVQWEIFEKGILFNYRYQLGSWSSSFNTNNVEIENDFIQMNYNYFENNMTIGTDSVNGLITFKRLPQ